MTSSLSILLSGGEHPTAVGGSLLHAAQSANHRCRYVSSDLAVGCPRIIRSVLWHCFDKRPPKLASYNRDLTLNCVEMKPRLLLLAGNLPVNSSIPKLVRLAGGKTAIWLTDDPWNPAHRCRRIMRLIPECDLILTPRRSNVGDLEQLAPGRVHHLPFGYDSRFFHHVPHSEHDGYLYDVFFAGGADADRIGYMSALARSPLKLGLYGSYWDRFRETQGLSLGYADPHNLSTLIARSNSGLCLVRKANRDGHAMRSFELAACRTAILAEDTTEHREIFGTEKALFFTTPEEAVEAGLLVKTNHQLRSSLISNAAKLTENGKNSYFERLQSIVSLSESF
jgi:spore maturation protein CgeB